MKKSKKIRPFLWYNGDVAKVAKFYKSVFKNAKIEITDANEDGSANSVLIDIEGQELMLFNGGPMFKFNSSVSLFVSCKDQKEVDRLWNQLSAGGGKKIQCGWLQDKYGLSWQIIPKAFEDMMKSDDQVKTTRVFQAMMKMKKLDISKLQKAFDGK